jgi:DNA adenine methylase
MTAAAAKTAPVILRNAAGEPPLGSAGAFFRDDQGEMFVHPAEAYRTPATRIGILELDNGRWLALPPSFHVERPQYDSREAALRAGIASLIRRARKYMRNKEGEGTHWTEGYAGRVIEWALSLKQEKALHQGAGGVAAAPSGHPGLAGEAADSETGVTDDTCDEPAGAVIQTSDPVVAELLVAHRARKEFPAGHTFSMTNPTVNGRWMNLGTCTCGDTFSYPYGSAGYERMDAAIEAHWQKFDHLADKIDGMGRPISGEAAPVPKPKRPRKRTKSDAPEGIPASNVANAGPQAASRSEPAPSLPPDGAGSADSKCDRCEPAQICAGGTGRVDDLGTVQDALKMSSDGLATPEPVVADQQPAATAPAIVDDDWLLRAAAALAWQEPPKVTDIQQALLDFGKVYALPRKVERPVLRWHGGKWKLAPWIMSHFPAHKVYIEPFGGAGSVLLQKLPVLTEVWNDLESEVVNLFRVLRSSTNELARAIYLTPFSREEYHSLYGACDDPVERARQFVARSFMGHFSKGALRKSGFDSRINPDGFASRLNSLRAMPEEFYAIADRFRDVIIEQRPAQDIFAQYDRADVLFYVDPPYLSDRAKHYTHELDEAGHTALLDTLRSLDGMAVVSGYRSELYDKALTDWRRVEIDAHADGGIDRVEVVWLNPACAAALDQQMPALFDLATFDAVNTPPPSRT